MVVKLFLLRGIWGRDTDMPLPPHPYHSLCLSRNDSVCTWRARIHKEYLETHDVLHIPYLYELRPMKEKQLVQSLLAGSRGRFRTGWLSDTPPSFCPSLLLSLKWKWKWSRSVVSDSLQPHGRYPTRPCHPWDFPGKNTGVGCRFLLQGIFTTQGSNPGLPRCRQTLYCLSHQGILLEHGLSHWKDWGYSSSTYR